MLTLYSYFRSSAAYRVRIALNLKGLEYETVPVNLLKGEQRGEAYRSLNPQGLVPALEADGTLITQSLAIIEYLEETHPAPPLLPSAPLLRAKARAIAQAIACDIHPLNNLRVLNYVKDTLNAGDAGKDAWYAHWIAEGFRAVEAMLQTNSGEYCVGDAPSIADCCLVPQVFNARRFKVDISPYPAILRVADRCAAHPAFIAAQPDKQPDAVA